MAVARSTGGISLPLVLLCLGLGTLAYYLAEEPLVVPPPSTISPAAQKIAALPKHQAYKAPILAELNEATSRPLLAQTRRPPKNPIVLKPIVPNAKAGASPLNHTLIGIFTTDDIKVALLHPKGKGPNIRLRVGDTVDGWKVTAITPEQVKFENAGETRILMPKPTVREKPRRAPRTRPQRRRTPR